jgi:hypothetical protein
VRDRSVEQAQLLRNEASGFSWQQTDAKGLALMFHVKQRGRVWVRSIAAST